MWNSCTSAVPNTCAVGTAKMKEDKSHRRRRRYAQAKLAQGKEVMRARDISGNFIFLGGAMIGKTGSNAHLATETPSNTPLSMETPRSTPLAMETPLSTPLAMETPLNTPFSMETPLNTPLAMETQLNATLAVETPLNTPVAMATQH